MHKPLLRPLLVWWALTFPRFCMALHPLSPFSPFAMSSPAASLDVYCARTVGKDCRTTHHKFT